MWGSLSSLKSYADVSSLKGSLSKLKGQLSELTAEVMEDLQESEEVARENVQRFRAEKQMEQRRDEVHGA